ncbi:MAG: hypothetical protein WC379_18245 [Methanoregula sp.]
MNVTRKEYYCIIARSFLPRSRTQMNRENVLYPEARDLVEWHQRCHTS